jgi:hypothetical protein
MTHPAKAASKICQGWTTCATGEFYGYRDAAQEYRFGPNTGRIGSERAPVEFLDTTQFPSNGRTTTRPEATPFRHGPTLWYSFKRARDGAAGSRRKSFEFVAHTEPSLLDSFERRNPR